MLQPEQRNLFFVGLMQPLGAIMPLAEQQARLIAGYLADQLTLPEPAAMQRDILRERAALERHYRRSPRHTMQVDFETYMHQITRALT